ncbi:MAG TPA: hypothetical protein VGE96_04735 [Steroidobacteraceae bacterium]
MNTSPLRPDAERPAERDDLSRRAQLIGIVGWCSFLAAGAFTTLLFAFLDPSEMPPQVGWWTGRPVVYTVGFFFLWGLAATSSALAVYLSRLAGPRPNGES